MFIKAKVFSLWVLKGFLMKYINIPRLNPDPIAINTFPVWFTITNSRLNYKNFKVKINL